MARAARKYSGRCRCLRDVLQGTDRQTRVPHFLSEPANLAVSLVLYCTSSLALYFTFSTIFYISSFHQQHIAYTTDVNSASRKINKTSVLNRYNNAFIRKPVSKYPKTATSQHVFCTLLLTKMGYFKATLPHKLFESRTFLYRIETPTASLSLEVRWERGLGPNGASLVKTFFFSFQSWSITFFIFSSISFYFVSNSTS